MKLETRVRIFALTWLSYASYYLTRKNFSVAKTNVMAAAHLTKQQLAHIDTWNLAAYALGQFVWGHLADRFGPRRVLAIGMITSAALSVAFGHSSTLNAYMLIWALNGFMQASGWSANVKAMTDVPPLARRGVVMGFWTTNYVFGGLLASKVAEWSLAAGGIPGAFTIPAIIVAGVGLVILFFLPDTEPRNHSGSGPTRAERRAAWREVVLKPRVWILGTSYFFMKVTRYAFLLWLVFYGETFLHYPKSTAVNVSLVFEMGGILGAVSIGLFSDRVMGGRRFPVGIASLVCLGVALFAYGQASQSGIGANIACLAAIGFFLYGPDAILSGAAAQDLGGPVAAATAAGIINGMGSIGPALGNEFWTAYSTSHSWNAAFGLLGWGAIASAIILTPLWRVGAARAS
jgi:sugar phosphate permease